MYVLVSLVYNRDEGKVWVYGYKVLDILSFFVKEFFIWIMLVIF